MNKRRLLLITTALFALHALWTREEPDTGTPVSNRTNTIAPPSPELEEDWEPQLATPIVPVMPAEMPDPLHPAPGSEPLLDDHNRPLPVDLSDLPALEVDPERGRTTSLE